MINCVIFIVWRKPRKFTSHSRSLRFSSDLHSSFSSRSVQLPSFPFFIHSACVSPDNKKADRIALYSFAFRSIFTYRLFDFFFLSCGSHFWLSDTSDTHTHERVVAHQRRTNEKTNNQTDQKRRREHAREKERERMNERKE